MTVAPPRSTGYRCREHPGEPVTWRGKGCTRCPNRKSKREASQPSDDTERQYWT
jgi:hypothetical protein